MGCIVNIAVRGDKYTYSIIGDMNIVINESQDGTGLDFTYNGYAYIQMIKFKGGEYTLTGIA